MRYCKIYCSNVAYAHSDTENWTISINRQYGYDRRQYVYCIRDCNGNIMKHSDEESWDYPIDAMSAAFDKLTEYTLLRTFNVRAHGSND